MSLFSSSSQCHADVLRKQLRAEGRKILRVDLELCGRPRKAILHLLALNESQLSRILSDEADASFPSELLPLWTEGIGPRYSEWLRLQMPDAPCSQCDENPLVLAGLLAKAIGDDLQALTADVAKDGVWDDRIRQLPGLFKARAFVDALIAIAQGGNATQKQREA